MTHIESMRAVTYASAVVIELAITNNDRASPVITGENSILIVNEFRVFYRQIDAFHADASAVPLGDAGALECNVLHSNVIGMNDEDRLALTGRIRQNNPWASAFDCYIVGLPDR